ncbi:unnamed protein product [Cuscuta europaea]|uniref:Secreted protein n=1 Tax=Cuscuta europaea TaxID=41803 RepID=A0A9P0Z042_CUSEU|nr:unnamed protein product [Cuscuta europaea]
MGLKRQIILILNVLMFGIVTMLDEIALADERVVVESLYQCWIVKPWSDALTVVELVFIHIAKDRPPPETPPYREEFCGILRLRIPS